MASRKSARQAYVEAEVATALAHQIRALRQQRGWSQRELARRLGTTQAAVSRLEDPGYGKPSLQTLLQLAHAFDTGLQVRFTSLVRMLQQTFTPRPQDDVVPPFEEESAYVGFTVPPAGQTAALSIPVYVTLAANAVHLSPTSISAKAEALSAA